MSCYVSLLNRSIQDLLDQGTSVPLTHHDPRDLRLICLEQKCKIRFQILSDLRIQSSILLTKCTLNHSPALVPYIHYECNPSPHKCASFEPYGIPTMRTFTLKIQAPTKVSSDYLKENWNFIPCCSKWNLATTFL